MRLASSSKCRSKAACWQRPIGKMQDRRVRIVPHWWRAAGEYAGPMQLRGQLLRKRREAGSKFCAIPGKCLWEAQQPKLLVMSASLLMGWQRGAPRLKVAKRLGSIWVKTAHGASQNQKPIDNMQPKEKTVAQLELDCVLCRPKPPCMRWRW